MNWFDFIFIAIVIVVAYLGIRAGLIAIAFTAIGLLMGVSVAGQLSDGMCAWFGNYISNDALGTVICDALIILGAFVLAEIVGRIGRKIVSMLFLGYVDRLGGLALGLIAGPVISAAAIIGMTDLTYKFEILEEGSA